MPITILISIYYNVDNYIKLFLYIIGHRCYKINGYFT